MIKGICWPVKGMVTISACTNLWEWVKPPSKNGEHPDGWTARVTVGSPLHRRMVRWHTSSVDPCPSWTASCGTTSRRGRYQRRYRKYGPQVATVEIHCSWPWLIIIINGLSAMNQASFTILYQANIPVINNYQPYSAIIMHPLLAVVN